MTPGILFIALVSRDIVVWDCNANEELITIEGIHKSICGDFLVRKEGEQYIPFFLIM